MPLLWQSSASIKNPRFDSHFFPTFGVGLLDFKLNSSLFSSPGQLLETPWSAQTQSLSGVPMQRVFLERILRVFLECPTPDCPTTKFPWKAPPEIPGVPNSRVSLESPPQSLPGVPNPERLPGVQNTRDSLKFPTRETPWSAKPRRLPGVPKSKSLRWGRSILFIDSFLLFSIYIYIHFFILGGGGRV